MNAIKDTRIVRDTKRKNTLRNRGESVKWSPEHNAHIWTIRDRSNSRIATHGKSNSQVSNWSSK